MTGRISSVGIILLFLSNAFGCVGAVPRISFDESRYPISMSAALLDGEGRTIGSERYRWKADYKAAKTAWAMGYTRLPLGRIDLSEDLNQQVEAAGGNAVVGLTVQAPASFCNVVNMVQITGLVPIYTGCARVVVEAEIVQVR